MTRITKTVLLAGAMMLGGTSAANAAHMAFTLGDNGNTLVSFDPANPSAVTTLAIAGNLSLDGLAYRPQTGELYAYSQDSNEFFVVDPTTGVATSVFVSGEEITDDIVGYDFNPALDASRLVTAGGDNIVFNPNDGGSVTRVNDLSYGMGYDPALSGPNVVGNAYLNQVPQDQLPRDGDGNPIIPQYVLDSQTDTIGILNNNAGTIDYVADTGFGFGSNGGLDIFTTPDGANIGYAILTGGDGLNAFYEISGLDPTVGDAIVFTFLGNVGFTSDVLQGLAVFIPDEGDVIPIPAAGLLFLTGAGGLAAARRRKARA